MIEAEEQEKEPRAKALKADDVLEIKNDVGIYVVACRLSGKIPKNVVLDIANAKVRAIGYYDPFGNVRYEASFRDEAALLRQFWHLFIFLDELGYRMVGTQLHDFVLPLLIQRSQVHQVAVPTGVIGDDGKEWSKGFLDVSRPSQKIRRPK